MSRAFVREDDAGDPPPPIYHLPPRDDEGYLSAAASALLEGARRSDIASAELATGHRWGDPLLRPFVERALADANQRGDDRLVQVAERYLRSA